MLFAQGLHDAHQRGKNSYQYFTSMWHTTGNLLFLTDNFVYTKQTNASSQNKENKKSEV